MPKTIVLIGTLDTKGDQVEYVKGKIDDKAHRYLVIDVGVLGKPTCAADITRDQVAEAAGLTIDKIIQLGEKGREKKAIDKMTLGCRRILERLNNEENIDCMLAFGGSMGTALALDVADVLPLAMPKFILSTIAYSPGINPNYYGQNIIMVPWIGGLWGLNEFSHMILDQTSALVSAAADVYERKPLSSKPLIGVVSLGMTASRYLLHLRPELEKRDYEVSVFHATGMSPRILEKAIDDGSVAAVLELFIGQEFIMEVMGSKFSAGPNRLEAAIKHGIPMVVAPGTLELISWPSYIPLPDNLSERQRLEHNSLLWMLFTDRAERVKAASMLAEKLNRATGPVAVVLPLKSPPGVVQYGIEDPVGSALFREELKNNLKSTVNVTEVECSQDDPEFSRVVADHLDKMMT